MLKIKFLGVNDSLQEMDGGNTSLLVFGKNGKVVVDLSCNIAFVVDEDIDAVILTHDHIDHVYALPSLLHQLWLGGRNKGLEIYIPKGMAQLVNGLIDLFKLREKKNMFEIRILEENKFKVKDMTITTFPTDHTNTSMGMVVEEGAHKLIYTCDTRPLKEILSFMKDAQVLIHEASGLEKEEKILFQKGHSSGADAGKLACRLKVKQLYLCHLPKGENAKMEILNEAKTIFSQSYIPEVFKDIFIGEEERAN